MSYVSRAQHKTNITNIKSLNSADGKIDAIEFQQIENETADSAAWEHQVYIMGANEYDCTNGNLQQRTLSGNATLAVTNAEPGKYYSLIKTNGFTYTMPTGHFSTSGNVTGTGRTLITFMYDGTNFHFSFSVYSAT